MNKHSNQQGSAHVVVVICLVLALVAALGWIFYQNFIYKEPVKKDTDLVVVDKKNETPTNETNRLVIKEWNNVAYNLPATIKSVEYTYDTSGSVVQGNAVRITSITTSEGVSFKLDTTKTYSPEEKADAICQSFGVVQKGTGDSATYEPFQLGAAGCNQSDAATAATDAVKEALKNRV